MQKIKNENITMYVESLFEKDDSLFIWLDEKMIKKRNYKQYSNYMLDRTLIICEISSNFLYIYQGSLWEEIVYRKNAFVFFTKSYEPLIDKFELKQRKW